MPFAGHPTIGTAFVANALGLSGCTGEAATLALNVGDIPVEYANGAWTFTANPHSSRQIGLSQAHTADMLGLDVRDFSGVEAGRYVDCGSEQLIVPVASVEALARVKPNAALLSGRARTKQGRYAVQVVARVASDRFQVRFFFPKDGGLTEDPGTGSACANLGGYLLDAGEPTPSQFTVTQGEFVNRLNVLQLSLTAEKRVRVGGRVLALGGGEIHLS